MKTPTTIRRLDIEKLDIPLKKPFGIATGAQALAQNALVSVELEDGTVGYGEAAPFPAYNGETQEMALSAIEATRSVVLGADARAYRAISASARPLVGKSFAALCALEAAILDALSKRAHLPLAAFFGGAERELSTDITITVGTIDEAREDARAAVAEGFSRLKVKVGAESVTNDVERLCAIRDAAPSAEFMLDGNGGFSAEAALDLIASLRGRGIVPILFEQPVPGDDWEGLAEVSRRAGVKVAADESVTTAQDAFRAGAHKVVHVVNIKPMKSGVVEALAIAHVARAAGLELMIGGMVEGRMAMSLSACLAAGFGGFSFIDLDTPLFLAEDPFEGGYAQEGARLELEAIERGHGVRPKAGWRGAPQRVG